MEKILKNKKVLAVLIALIVVLAGVVVICFGGKGPKEEGKSGTKIEIDKAEPDGDEYADDPGYKDSELDVSNGPADSIDGSGDWDAVDDSDEKESTKKDDKKDKDKNDNKDDNKDTSKEDTPKEDTDKEESGNMSGQDILVDDKEWGKID